MRLLLCLALGAHFAALAGATNGINPAQDCGPDVHTYEQRTFRLRTQTGWKAQSSLISKRCSGTDCCMKQCVHTQGCDFFAKHAWDAGFCMFGMPNKPLQIAITSKIRLYEECTVQTKTTPAPARITPAPARTTPAPARVQNTTAPALLLPARTTPAQNTPPPALPLPAPNRTQTCAAQYTACLATSGAAASNTTV